MEEKIKNKLTPPEQLAQIQAAYQALKQTVTAAEIEGTELIQELKQKIDALEVDKILNKLKR